MTQNVKNLDGLESISLFCSPTRILQSPTITIVVGSSATVTQVYNLHCEPLKEVSAYFAALLSSSMIETISRQVELTSEADDPTAFAMFAQFLYLKDYHPEQVQNLPNAEREQCLLHGKVYVLAEKLCAAKLKDLAIEKLSKALEDTQPRLKIIPKLVEVIYDHTTGGNSSKRTPEDGQGVTQPTNYSGQDPARDLVVRFCAANVEELRRETDFMNCVAQYSEFAQDLVWRLGGRLVFRI